MTLQHANRVRKNGGEQVICDLQFAEASGPNDGAPTRAQIRRRAYENYLNRNGGRGDAVSDWLQAECELCTCNAQTIGDIEAINQGSPDRFGKPMCESAPGGGPKQT